MSEDTMTDTPKHYEIADTEIHYKPWQICAEMEAFHATRDQAVAAAEAHRAAVVADSPELAQARADVSRRLAERDEERAIIDGLRAALGLKPGVGLDLAALTAVARDKLSEDDMESADAIDGLVRESLELRALAEDELAQARERIAALEDMWTAATAGMDQFLTERDAALVKVAALEDERVHVKQVADTWQAVTDGLNARIVALEAEQKADAEACAKATWTAVVLVTERDAALARVRELEAAAQPKPRDESVPPPGWEWDDVVEAAAEPEPRHLIDDISDIDLAFERGYEGDM